MEINDILNICQESGAIAEDVRKIITEFENSITEGDLYQAEEATEKMKKELGENHPKVTWAEETLELEKIPLGQ